MAIRKSEDVRVLKKVPDRKNKKFALIHASAWSFILERLNALIRISLLLLTEILVMKECESVN